jgi:hypothetical protein
MFCIYNLHQGFNAVKTLRDGSRDNNQWFNALGIHELLVEILQGACANAREDGARSDAGVATKVEDYSNRIE